MFSGQPYVRRLEGWHGRSRDCGDSGWEQRLSPSMWHAGVLTSHPQVGLVFEVPGGALVAGVLATLGQVNVLEDQVGAVQVGLVDVGAVGCPGHGCVPVHGATLHGHVCTYPLVLDVGLCGKEKGKNR